MTGASDTSAVEPILVTTFDELIDLVRAILETLLLFVPEERQLDALAEVEARLTA